MLGKSLYIGETIDLTSVDTEKDAAMFSKWTQDPVFFRGFQDGYFRLIPEFEMKKKLAEKLKKAEEKRDAYYFCVRKHETSELIGFVRIIWVLHSHQVGFIHIDFGSNADFDQYADEALKMILRYGFMEASLHRLEMVIPSYEGKLVNLLERHGFLREVQRREAIFHGGQYYDELAYALLKPDYKKALAEG
jgi:RimJ/RimL family protein N-acetyltransferase